VAFRVFDLPSSHQQCAYPDDNDEEDDEPNSERIDHASMQEIVGTPFGKKVIGWIELSVLPLSPFHRRGQQFTVQAFGEYVPQLIAKTNEQLREGRGTAHVPNTDDMIRNMLQQHADAAKADYASNPAKPNPNSFTGKEAEAMVLQQHNGCVERATTLFTTRTSGLKTWTVYPQIVEALKTHFLTIRTTIVNNLNTAARRLNEQRATYTKNFQDQVSTLRTTAQGTLGTEFPADLQCFQQVINKATSIAVSSLRPDYDILVKKYQTINFTVSKEKRAVTVNDPEPIYEDKIVRDHVGNENIYEEVDRCNTCSGCAESRFWGDTAERDREAKKNELYKLKAQGKLLSYDVRGFHTGGVFEMYRFMYYYQHADNSPDCYNKRREKVVVGFKPIYEERIERVYKETRYVSRVVQAAKAISCDVRPLCQLIEGLVNLQQQYQLTF
jgi:hypothetical protein